MSVAYIVSGVLFAVAAVAMGVGMGAQQQLGTRRRTALEKTLRNRPDLLDGAGLSEEDKELLAGIASKEI